jgi:hypothetical protein
MTTNKMIMTERRFQILILLMFLGIAFISFTTDSKNETDDVVPYPEGYREWTHVKTYIVGPKSPAFKFIGGFNHVYANDKAMKGYKTGHFPNGSVIVSDVIQAKEDSVDIREGPRHHLDVMVRDSIKYADAGGWRFEEFQGDSPTVRLLNVQTRVVCSNCHARQRDMVFSEYRK